MLFTSSRTRLSSVCRGSRKSSYPMLVIIKRERVENLQWRVANWSECRRFCDVGRAMLQLWNSLLIVLWRIKTKENIGWKLWMLHEAINWNFLEFSPSTIFALFLSFCAIYSLIVAFCLPVSSARLNKFNGFELSRAKSCSKSQKKRKNPLFRITRDECVKVASTNRGRRAFCRVKRNLNNVQLSIHRIWCAPPSLPALSLFPNYIWPFPFPAETASRRSFYFSPAFYLQEPQVLEL